VGGVYVEYLFPCPEQFIKIPNDFFPVLNTVQIVWGLLGGLVSRTCIRRDFFNFVATIVFEQD
jgi:hypothetical protein